MSTIPQWLKHSKSNLALIFDLDGNITGCNDLFTETFATKKQPQHIKDIFSKEDLLTLNTLFNTFSSDSSAQLHFIGKYKKDSIYKWEFMLFAEGYIIGIAQQQISIAERTKSLVNVSHLIDSFMNNSPASAWVCDEDGKLLNMNKYFLTFLGLTTADIGKTLWEVYPKHIADLYHRNNCVVFETNKTLKTEELSINAKGKTRNFLVYKFPLSTIDHKKLVGGWAIDITERKIAEQKIFEHDLKMKELAFLQSHEVRRPLANILGLLELIKTDAIKILDEHMQHMLLYVQSSATELDDEIRKVIYKLQEK